MEQGISKQYVYRTVETCMYIGEIISQRDHNLDDQEHVNNQ